jgi:DNA-binding SARP family transcriptional activator
VIPTLHIHLLGDFLLVSGDTPVTTVNIPRLQSLLAYLVLHRNAPQNRSHLAFLLWPDSTEVQAHTNLRKLLYQLRQALPDAGHFLHADKHNLQWQPAPDGSWTFDVQDVEQALAQAIQAEQAQETSALRQALEQAVHLYGGDLLPSCYDEWILPERDRLHQLFLQAAEQLITLLEQERKYDAAIAAAQRLLRHEPLNEATYRHLMRLYVLRGDRAAALRIYHTCVTVLERELAAVQQTGNKDQVGFPHFALGVCLLWSGHLDEAEEHLRAAMSAGDQTGNAELLGRSLTFLPFIFRLRGQVEQVRSIITRALAVPAARKNSIITGHRAWVAWRDGDMVEAEAYGRASLEGRQDVSLFHWTSLWPLIGVMLIQEKFANTIDYVRMLLDPTQQSPPEQLRVLLEAALQAWDAGQQKEACSLLQQAVPLAEQMGYL